MLEKAPDISIKKYKHEPSQITFYESYFSRILFNHLTIEIKNYSKNRKGE